MVLSHREVERRLISGEISIYYSFLRISDNDAIKYFENEVKVKPNDDNSIATQFFRERMGAFRLQLTVGPIAKTHSSKPIPNRPIYQGQPQCTDLRANGNELIIEPYEVISIATNERVVFGGETAAIVTPRVTNTDSGLLLTTAYIDPYYDGILRVVVSNMTDHQQILHLLEPIAQCIFFGVDGEIDPSFKAEFAHKSVFYGQNWKRIIDEQGDPFPRRKKPVVKQSFSDKFKFFIEKARANLASSILTLGFITTLVVFLLAVGNFQSEIARFQNLQEKLDQNEKKLTELDDKLHFVSDEVNKKLPIVGKDVVAIPANTNHIASNEIKGLWIQADPSTSTSSLINDIRYKILKGLNPNESIIEINVELKQNPSVNIDIQIQWLVLR